MIQTKRNTPWYRVGMVWLMIGLPMSAVVASMVTLVIAHQNSPIIIVNPGIDKI